MGGDNWGGEEEGNLSGKGSSEDPRNPHGTNLCPPPLLGPPYAGTALGGGGGGAEPSSAGDRPGGTPPWEGQTRGPPEPPYGDSLRDTCGDTAWDPHGRSSSSPPPVGKDPSQRIGTPSDHPMRPRTALGTPMCCHPPSLLSVPHGTPPCSPPPQSEGSPPVLPTPRGPPGAPQALTLDLDDLLQGGHRIDVGLLLQQGGIQGLQLGRGPP